MVLFLLYADINNDEFIDSPLDRPIWINKELTSGFSTQGKKNLTSLKGKPTTSYIKFLQKNRFEQKYSSLDKWSKRALLDNFEKSISWITMRNNK